CLAARSARRDDSRRDLGCDRAKEAAKMNVERAPCSVLNAVKTKSGRSWPALFPPRPAGALDPETGVIAALADRVRHAKGRSPEGQEAGGRPCRMIFRSRNRRCHQGSTEHTSLRKHYPKQAESPCLAPKSIRNCLRTSGRSLIGSTA